MTVRKHGRELFLSSTTRQNQDVWILTKCHLQVSIAIKNINFKLFPDNLFFLPWPAVREKP